MKECISCHNKVEDLLHKCPHCGGGSFMSFSQDAAALLRDATDAMLKQKKANEHNDSGGRLMMQGHYAEGEKEFRQAIEANPLNATAHSNLGVALYKQGRLEEAIPWLEKALSINPRLDGVPLALAQYKAEAKEKLSTSRRIMDSKHKKPVIHHGPLTHAEKERRITRWITIGFAITGVIIVLLIGYGILNETVFKNSTPVATIGSEKITGGEFIERVKYQRKQIVDEYRRYYDMAQIYASDQNIYSYFTSQLPSIQAALADPKQFGQSVLDQMVKERIIVMEAAKKGIKVNEQEIDLFLQSQLEFFPNGTPTISPTPIIFGTPTYSPTQIALLHYTPTPTLSPAITAATETTLSTPAPTNTAQEPTITPEPQGITPGPTSSASVPTSTSEPTPTVYTQELYDTKLKEVYANLKSADVSEQALRGYVRDYLIRLKLQDVYNLNPEKSEQVWARHILVKTEADAKLVLNRLASGEDWAKIAAEVSIDTGTKDLGGDLGWFTKGKMVKAFEEAAFALKAGEISAPVQTDFGWHVIQTVGHDPTPMTFDDWVAQIKSGLKIELKNWENIVPVEPTIPPELIIPTEPTIPTELIIPTQQP